MKNNKPKIRFKDFTGPWEQRKLRDIVGIYDGVHQTPKYQDGGIMFLSVENIATLHSSKYISEEDFKRDYKVYPQENDILMTRIGDVGTTNVVTDNGLKAYYVSLALLKYRSTNPFFLSNAIQSDYVQNGLSNRTLKTAIPMKINKDEIGKVDVMLPTSTDEQVQIGTYFRNLDNLITLHQRKCDNLKKSKKLCSKSCFPKMVIVFLKSDLKVLLTIGNSVSWEMWRNTVMGKHTKMIFQSRENSSLSIRNSFPQMVKCANFQINKLSRYSKMRLLLY